MTIRSNPPGALVFVDEQPIGITPVSTRFTYYGTREIRVIKDGYETVTQNHTFRTPWYEYPPLDFFTENLWPFEVRDERMVDFELPLSQVVPTQAVLERGEQLRASAQQGVVTAIPPGAAAPAPTAPLPQR